VLFDVVVVTLSLSKLKSHSTSGISYVIYRDSMMYFFATTITNIVVLAIEAIQRPDFDLIKPMAVPFSTLMIVTMASRVFLNLKLYNQRKTRTGHGLPYSMNSHQTDSAEQRSSDKFFPHHHIASYPHSYDGKRSQYSTGSVPSSMPINITRETLVAS
jgi:hypothetical protein